MSNPQGFNGVDPIEPAYGARKQMGMLQRSAPIVGQGSSASAQDTPRRAQRHALRPRGGDASLPLPLLAPAASPQAAVQAFWQQAAPFLGPDLQWLAAGT